MGWEGPGGREIVPATDWFCCEEHINGIIETLNGRIYCRIEDCQEPNWRRKHCSILIPFFHASLGRLIEKSNYADPYPSKAFFEILMRETGSDDVAERWFVRSSLDLGYYEVHDPLAFTRFSRMCDSGPLVPYEEKFLVCGDVNVTVCGYEVIDPK